MELILSVLIGLYSETISSRYGAPMEPTGPFFDRGYRVPFLDGLHSVFQVVNHIDFDTIFSSLIHLYSGTISLRYGAPMEPTEPFFDRGYRVPFSKGFCSVRKFRVYPKKVSISDYFRVYPKKLLF